MLDLTPDGEVDGRDHWPSSEQPPRPLPFDQPCTLTVCGVPRVADGLIRRLGFDHAQIVCATNTAIVVSAWNDTASGQSATTVRTFQAALRFATIDPSLAIGFGNVRELNDPVSTTQH